MNISNFSLPVALSPNAPIEIKAENLVRDYVYQVDQKILLCILLIFVCFVAGKIILPKAKEGLTDMMNMSVFKGILEPFLGMVIWFNDRLISLSETFALGCAGFLFGIAWYQGILPYSYKLIAGLMVALVVLVGLVNFMAYIKDKRYKDDLNKIELGGIRR